MTQINKEKILQKIIKTKGIKKKIRRKKDTNGTTFKVQGGLKLKGDLHPHEQKMKHYKYYVAVTY